jgi:hypothetical protein
VKRSVLTDGRGVPLGIAIAGANAHDQKLLEATLRSIPVKRPRSRGRRRQHLCLDKGYFGQPSLTIARRCGYQPHVRCRHEEQRQVRQRVVEEHDGAAAAIVMSAARARTLGIEPLGYLRDYALAGCDPSRMGLGPVFAIHKLLKKTGLALGDFDLFEINEAFAAQVLACLKALSSAEFATRSLGESQPVGAIDTDRLNVNGGAIALGHPVGASGARLIITLLRALRERGQRRGLATLCVGGGQGAAVWLETEFTE